MYQEGQPGPLNTGVILGVCYGMARWKRAWYAWFAFWGMTAAAPAGAAAVGGDRVMRFRVAAVPAGVPCPRRSYTAPYGTDLGGDLRLSYTGLHKRVTASTGGIMPLVPATGADTGDR